MRLDARPHNVFSEYREFPVRASLANHFLCFWEQVIIGSGEYAHPVLRDACIDIVFISVNRSSATEIRDCLGRQLPVNALRPAIVMAHAPHKKM